MSLPKISSYGRYSSDNYGAHCLCVQVGSIAVFFSYTTPVAFSAPGTDGVVVRENVWGKTTGKHLNWIDGGNKKARVSSEEFERRFAELGI